jgi:hypothetical protein
MEIADGFSLINFPSPFNAQTSIRFKVSHTSIVALDVLDIVGRSVAHIYNGCAAAGTHAVGWDGAAQVSGVYLIRLQTGNRFLLHKMLLQK